RVDARDLGLAPARQLRGIAGPYPAATHRRSVLGAFVRRPLTAQPWPAWWNCSEAYRAETAMSSHAPEGHPARPIMLATLAISSAGSTGLVRWMLKPACRLRIRSSRRPKAVSATAGIFPPRPGLRVRHFPLPP